MNKIIVTAAKSAAHQGTRPNVSVGNATKGLAPQPTQRLSLGGSSCFSPCDPRHATILDLTPGDVLLLPEGLRLSMPNGGGDRWLKEAEAWVFARFGITPRYYHLHLLPIEYPYAPGRWMSGERRTRQERAIASYEMGFTSRIQTGAAHGFVVIGHSDRPGVLEVNPSAGAGVA